MLVVGEAGRELRCACGRGEDTDEGLTDGLVKRRAVLAVHLAGETPKTPSRQVRV